MNRLDDETEKNLLYYAMTKTTIRNRAISIVTAGENFAEERCSNLNPNLEGNERADRVRIGISEVGSRMCLNQSKTV